MVTFVVNITRAMPVNELRTLVGWPSMYLNPRRTLCEEDQRQMQGEMQATPGRVPKCPTFQVVTVLPKVQIWSLSQPCTERKVV